MTATTSRARAAIGMNTDQPPPEPDTIKPEPEPIVEPASTPAAAVELHQTAALMQPAPRGSLQEKITYAKALAEAGLLPEAYRRQPGNVLLAVEMAEALQIAPYTAIQQVHILDGKPSASAGLIQSLVRRAGHRVRLWGDDTEAFCEIVRADDPDFTFRSHWTKARSEQAGLFAPTRSGKPSNHTKYPAAMFKARALTECARDACQEALMGVMYTPEELGAQVDLDGEPVVGGTVREPSEDWPGVIAAATTPEEVRAIYQRCFRAGEINDGLVAVMSARTAELESNTVDAEVVEDGTERPAAAPTGRVLQESTPEYSDALTVLVQTHGARADEAVMIACGGEMVALGYATLDEIEMAIGVDFEEIDNAKTNDAYEAVQADGQPGA